MTARVNIQAADWTQALDRLPADARDFYFTAGYHRLHELNGDGAAFFSIAAEGRNVLMVGGMLAAIPPSGDIAGYADVESCNGYGGPLASTDTPPGFVTAAWQAWKQACAAQGIVAAFFRLHPLLGNEALLPADAEVRFDRRTVFADLTAGTERLLQAASSQHRNMVSKAKRDGENVRWNQPEDWHDFVPLYADAMTRVNAPERLRFNHAYFEALRALPGVSWAALRKGTSLCAAAIFLGGETWWHYHLAARSAEAPNYVMSYLLQAAFERAALMGIRGVHLGGGKTAAPDDSLLRFKMSTGGRLLDFKVGLVVANTSVYERLNGDWRRQAGTSPDWLLGYRQPLPRVLRR